MPDPCAYWKLAGHISGVHRENRAWSAALPQFSIRAGEIQQRRAFVRFDAFHQAYENCVVPDFE